MPRPRIALVTGANRGIGEAIARALASTGDHTVVVGARSLDAAIGTARGLGGGAFGVALDVTDAASVTTAITEIERRAGHVEVLINNAGGHYDSGTRPSEVGDTDALDALDVNLLGPWRLIRAVVPSMRAGRWGRIVNVSSRSGSFSSTWADAPAYGVSKAALNMLTLQLSQELAGTGILVNTCCPGWVRTEMGGADADKSVDEGADTPVWLATLPDDGPSGGFWGERQRLVW